jgi:2-keto-4-pentenoate hydratase/2-oxohepta-3-ene-1,7-dioic acid hydratase in catechol pathway
VQPLYRRRKVWGIGLNYRDHAVDLAAPFPTEPASFMKGDHTIIGDGEAIELPPESERVTAEAELGVIIGRRCRDVAEDDFGAVIAGYCLIIDMTAEDILQRNPRFLTRSKNFDTFFSFGPELVTPEEVLDVMRLNVGTWCNGVLHRQTVVANMAFPPAYLVAFHSRVMTLPGDIISTGPRGRRSSTMTRRVPHRWPGQLEQPGAPQQRGLSILAGRRVGASPVPVST